MRTPGGSQCVCDVNGDLRLQSMCLAHHIWWWGPQAATNLCVTLMWISGCSQCVCDITSGDEDPRLQPIFLWHHIWWRGSQAATNLFVALMGISGYSQCVCDITSGDKQRVLMHGHQGWNVRHGLCHIYMIYVYIWVVHSFCLFCCLFIIVTTQFVALYEPCKPKPKPKPSTYDTRTTTPWQRSKFRYLDRSQSNKYAINMQIQTISVSK